MSNSIIQNFVILFVKSLDDNIIEISETMKHIFDEEHLYFKGEYGN